MEESHHDQGLIRGDQQVSERDKGKTGQPREESPGLAQDIRHYPGRHLEKDPGDGGDGDAKADSLGSGPQGGGKQRQDRGAGQGVGSPGQEAHGTQAIKGGDRLNHGEASRDLRYDRNHQEARVS